MNKVFETNFRKFCSSIDKIAFFPKILVNTGFYCWRLSVCVFSKITVLEKSNPQINLKLYRFIQHGSLTKKSTPTNRQK